MVNLRYHIVSITAVFLALGIGLFMGSSMLSDLALSGVERNLQRAEARIAETNERSAELTREVEESNERDAQLREFGAPQIFGDHLESVPVLVIAAEGADRDSLNSLHEALSDTRADFEGTLVLTGKLALEGDAADQLATVLGQPGSDPEQIREVLVDRLGGTLVDAAAGGAPTGEGDVGGEPGTGDEPGDPPAGTTTPPAGEPDLITSLRDAGFLELIPAPEQQEDAPVLTGGGYRYVFVSGPEAEISNEELFLPLVRDMAQEAPAPLVVASTPDEDAVQETREAVVGPIREDEEISDRVATVDDLETFAGIVAVILELDRLDDEERGHFGVGDGATSVLPPPST